MDRIRVLQVFDPEHLPTFGSDPAIGGMEQVALWNKMVKLVVIGSRVNTGKVSFRIRIGWKEA